MNSSKLCKRCGIIKPHSEYTPSKVTSDKCQSYCRACYAELAKNRRLKNPEKYKEQDIAFKNRHRDLINKRKREARQANLEKYRTERKKQYYKNREQELKKAREYKAKHAEQLAKKQSEYLKQNPHISRYFTSKRRAAEKMATPAWASSKKIMEFYITADGLGMCTGDWYEVDHIVPLQSKLVCGLHCEANLQVLPRSENRSKSNRYWPDMP